MIREYNLTEDQVDRKDYALTLDWTHSETSIQEIRQGPQRSPRKMSVAEQMQRLEAMLEPDMETVLMPKKMDELAEEKANIAYGEIGECSYVGEPDDDQIPGCSDCWDDEEEPYERSKGTVSQATTTTITTAAMTTTTMKRRTIMIKS
jgi:hypothetical protein